MPIYDYRALLLLDGDTYTEWGDTLENYETAAILNANALAGVKLETSGNQLLEEYCKEKVFVRVYGDGLSASILNYHLNAIANYEEQFRYGLGVV